MKRAESLVDLKALVTLIALTMTMMVASMMATMVAPRVSSQGKERVATGGGGRGVKKGVPAWETMPRPNSGADGRFDDEASMVASMASMVASRASVVASLVESRNWLKRRGQQSPKKMMNELTDWHTVMS